MAADDDQVYCDACGDWVGDSMRMNSHATAHACQDCWAHVLAERDRLRAILDAEQGRKGLEGWDRQGSTYTMLWWRKHNGVRTVATVGRQGSGWSWQARAGFQPGGFAPTALEAMEAAEKALAEVTHD